MKKSTLALSVAAALSGFGFAGNALANNFGGATADTMILNQDGIGHQLVFPYFTTQGENATMLNITNSDTINGKLLKVRFRGAANSDDVFDFQLLMSPGDMWTAAVTQDATSKISVMKSGDKSCTIPAEASGTLFLTTRVDSAPATGDSANETREGYIEVINMADIPAGSALFTTVKHVDGKAPCSATVLQEKLGADFASLAAANTAGLTNPTGGLAGNWFILNQANTSVWSGSATAMQAVTRTGTYPILFTNAKGNLVFWPQKAEAPVNGLENTADALFTKGVEPIQSFDLPDLSTPYVLDDTETYPINTLGSAYVRSANTSRYFAVSSVSNELVTADDIGAVTDLLFTQPTRRYHVAVNYKASSAVANTTDKKGVLASAIYSDTDKYTGAVSYYTTSNTTLSSRRVCLNNLTKPGLNTLFNREEGTAPGTGFVVSPGVPGAEFAICGEAAVTSINGLDSTSSLSATVARNNVEFPGFTDGWLTFNTANGGLGVPMIGAAFIRVNNGTVNYGIAWNNKVTRP